MSLPEFFAEYSTRAKDAHNKADLITLLSSQGEDGVERLQEVGGDAMTGPLTNFDGSPWTRMQWFFMR